MPFALRWSLNRQVVLPLIAACVISAVGLALVSQWQAQRQAAAESRARLASVSTALADTSFPINDDILDMLRALSGLEFIVLDVSGSLRATSQGISQEAARQVVDEGKLNFTSTTSELTFVQELRLDNEVYRAAKLYRPSGRDSLLILLEPQSKRRAAGQQLAVLPLVTGLATLVLVGAVSLAVSQRLVHRISDAERQVQQIASGEREQVLIAGPDDQLTSLTLSVNHMADELRSMWRTIRETERSRLLSQVASGLAHQLRNAITGIHLAVQLHRRDCPVGNDESLKVAEAELARTAAYIQQLLHSAAGKEQQAQAGPIDSVMNEAQSLLQTIANHRQVALRWQRDAQAEQKAVSDRELLRSAVMNLVLNALDAAGPGGQVAVRTSLEADGVVSIEVEDSGAGPAPELSEHLFDPFVSSKPEGLGVGLSVVRSAAATFQGTATWRRQNQRTVFELRMKLNGWSDPGGQSQVGLGRAK